MKPYIPMFIVLLLVSSSFLGVSYRVEKSSSMSFDGKTLYVGGSGEDNYTKIQDAIDNASDGDTVFVYNGTYYEHRIYINKSITLKGEDKNTTILDGEGFGRIITFKTDGIILRGFTFINTEEVEKDTCIISIGSNYNEIFDNILLDNKVDGIIVWDEHHHNIIRDNYIKNSSYGILLRYEGYNLQIMNNEITKCKYGVLVNSLGYNVSGNTVANNIYGIYVASLGEITNTVSDNIVINNSEIGIGIESYTSYCFVSGNIINNSYYGITIESGESNIISKNLISNCFYSIYIINSAKNVISKNNLMKSVYGIISSGSANQVLANNFFENKRDAAFWGIPTTWLGNYWQKPRDFPKIIIGMVGFLGLIPWVNFDWHPAKEPNNISLLGA